MNSKCEEILKQFNFLMGQLKEKKDILVKINKQIKVKEKEIENF